MTSYRVSVKSKAGDEGIDVVANVVADDVEAAKEKYAAMAGSTVEALESFGLTEWSVEEEG